jgi:tetratricopeptide (TPR) repeat protein
MTINRLTKREAGAMIDGVVGNKLLPASIRQDIIERTDGIPLFVEELTKAVLETESVGEAKRTAAAVPSPILAVPASLHASLMSRLDRLGPAKELGQIGAAIGREFSHALLAAVARKPEAQLQSSLDRLIDAGLLFRQGVPPHSTYLFKHALVQDAAYGTLLREPRRALHARIANVLESQFTEIAESQPELRARHCAEAGLIEKAVGLWGKAGQRSLEQSALAEAIEQFARALAQIATLPSTPGLRRQEIKLQAALITPLIHVKGYTVPETRAAVERAHLLIEQAETRGEAPEDPLLSFSVLNAFIAINVVAFNGDAALALAMQFLTLAEKKGTTTHLMLAHRGMGVCSLHRGDIAKARRHLEQTIALYDRTEHGQLATRFSEDPAVHVLGYRSFANWYLGYPGAALADADRALSDAREIGQAATLMNALSLTNFTYTFCGNYAKARALIDDLVSLANEKGASHWRARGLFVRGWLLAVTGEAAGAVQMITSGLSEHRSMGATVFVPFYLSYLGGAYGQLGQFEDAWCCISEAITAMETTGERWCEAEVHRIAGEIVLKSPEPDMAKAEACFKRAGGFACATSKILGAARGDEHGAALARSGQTTAGP